MSDRDESLKLTRSELNAPFESSDAGKQYPPVMTAQQAAALLQVPVATIYDWSSRGLLRGCARRCGKHLRFFRDRFLEKLFNEGILHDSKQLKS